MLQPLVIARFLITFMIASSAAAVAGFVAIFMYLNPKLPDVDVLRDTRLQTPLRIYSRDGMLIGEFGEKRRTPVSYEEVPQQFINAFLAAEDDRFYDHHGVDITGLLRAASQLIASGQIQTGGSTITMQVAKNYFLSQERTFSRKFNEIFLALKIERALSKADIMELYINKIFLGNHAYGIEAAAQVYYGKSIQNLEVQQMAMIAGLPKAPSAFNPIVNPTRARVRRDWILGRMHKLGFIGEDEYHAAVNAPLTASYHGSRSEIDAPYVAEMTRLEMIRRYGLDAYTEGYHAYTTIDSRLQETANQAVINGVGSYDWRHGYRGPEQQLNLGDTPLDLAQPPEEWLKALRDHPPVGPWQAALVISVEEKSFQALLANGEIVSIDWDSGLSETARFITIDRVTLPPKTADVLVSRGDIVRVVAPGVEGGGWRLAQVPEAQGSLVALNADTGAILSLVGGLDYRMSSYNRISQAQRQPGSNFKPFIYAAALANGFTAATVINDAPIVFEDKQLESTWRPTNDSGKFYGPTRLRKALYNSRNLVSIRLLRELGIGNAISYLENFGFDTSKLPTDLSLALGSHSMTPLDIVSAYAILANGGYRVEPYLIERIADHDHQEIFRAKPATVCRECEAVTEQDQLPTTAPATNEDAPPAEEELLTPDSLEEFGSIEELLAQAEKPPVAERVVDERVAYLIDNILRDVIRRGTGRRARSLERSDLAGKTGTTNGPTDAWFSGYGSGIVATTWVGFDKNQKLGRREYGGSVALPIWIDFMKVALEGRPESEWKQPDGIVSVRIDPLTGQLARADQRDAIFEIFREEYVPTASSPATGGEALSGDPESENIELF